MSCKNVMLLFLVTASLNGFNGRDVGVEAFVQRPTLQGRVHLKSVVSDDESVVPTRYGSLAFREGGQKSTRALHSLIDSKLKRLDPVVRCSDHLMTLKVKRAGEHHVLVKNGVGLLTPLTQMPSSCGYSVKRSRRDVLFSAPYQGCHVTQQGDDFVLPLHLWGAPMAMSCPAVLPPPSVTCFRTGMVVKIWGVTANGLKVKVSGAWMSFSSVCGSCGFTVEATSEGLTLTAPYNISVCTEIKDEKHSLYLQMVDVELLVTCPSLPDIKPTTTMPPSDSGQVLQVPQFHQYPMFQQNPVLPLPTYPAHTSAPTTGKVAPLPQQPQFISGPNNEAPAGQHPSFPLMQQYPQLSQYIFYPRPVQPTQATPTKNTAATEAKLPQFPSGPAAELGPKMENQESPAGQHPSLPFMQQYAQFPQYLYFPRPIPPTRAAPTKNAAATTSTTTEAKLPQFPSGPPAESGPNNKNQGAPAGQHPSFPFMQQYPQLPQYFFFPRPVPPTRAAPTKTAAATAATTTTTTTTTEAKLPQLPQFPSGPAAESGPKKQNQGAPAGQHPSFPFMQQYPQLPQQIFFPKPVPPTQATPTKCATKNIAAGTAEAKLPQVPQSQQLPQFLVPPQYSFLAFPKLPLSREGLPQAISNPKPLIQQPKPQPVYPQIYQMPVFFPPHRYPSQRQNTQTDAPTTTSTSAATTPKPAVQKPFPHPYMPLYHAPQQSPKPVFPDPPATPPTNPALFDQQHQPMYWVMPRYYPFPPRQTKN